MRFFITNLLATAMVVFAAGSASAISLTLAGANGQLVSVGGQVTVTVTLDTGATTGLVLLSTGVLFDDEILNYNSAASSAPTYILYVNGKTPYMQPAANPPELRFGTTNQVNVDWVATNLQDGTGGTDAASLLATLVFDVVSLGDGTADIGLSITSPGNIVQLAGGVNTTATLNGSGTVITPEPTTALLVGLGLLGLGVAGRRRE
jgi:hypothetical protein